MARVNIPEGDGWERQRMWQLCPEIGEAAERFSRICEEATIVPMRVHEAARMRIALINGCLPCQAARPADRAAHGLDEAFYEGLSDPGRRSGYSEGERLGMEFAERFLEGAWAFDDEFWSRMHAAFTDAEIVDLTATCAKWLGFSRLNTVLELALECPIETRVDTPVEPAALV